MLHHLGDKNSINPMYPICTPMYHVTHTQPARTHHVRESVVWLLDIVSCLVAGISLLRFCGYSIGVLLTELYSVCNN